LKKNKEKIENKELAIFGETKKWLNEYFEGKNPKNSLKLKLEGSSFRQDVWSILLEIPYGKVITYGDIAKKLEKKYQCRCNIFLICESLYQKGK